MRRTMLLLGLSLAACSTTGTEVAPERDASAAPQASMAGKATATAKNAALDRAITAYHQLTLSENPVFATTQGVRDFDQSLGDPSLAAYDRGIEARRALRAELSAIRPTGLSADEALNRELLLLELDNDIAASAFGGKYMVMTNRDGPHLDITGLPDRLPFRTVADYESYVARLGAVPAYMDAATERLRAGLLVGWVQPCEPMSGYEDSINVHVVLDPADSVLMAPFAEAPAGVPTADFERLRSAALETIRQRVVPAFRTFETFYNLEYQPACRVEVGTSTMPGGAAYYEHRVQLFTTTAMTADEIHALGLREVARIRAEMEEIARADGYPDLRSFQAFLRTNKAFYPATGEARMERASRIAKRMDGQLVKLFTVLPRMPYDIREIPLDIAEKTTTAYYSQPAGDGSRAGTYWLNTTKLETRPLYDLEALTLHEAVPGHHFQLALQQELDLPPFRRFGGFTAFVEGWGLYAERLGLEVGFYDTPYTNFGRLSYEMWRACRLVVDTGIHAKGWSRDQAIRYMLDNTGLSQNEVTTEVDRYITWPGQALAYKIGELKIRELRARAERALGEKFDVRRFHDAVLEAGAVPLSVLETRIDAFIAREAGRS